MRRDEMRRRETGALPRAPSGGSSPRTPERKGKTTRGTGGFHDSAGTGHFPAQPMRSRGTGGDAPPPAAGGIVSYYRPAISRRRRIRSSVGGWVENSEAMDMPAKGLTINRFSVAGLACMGICRA